LDREDAELIRVATYTFRSLVAEDWRVGRILLAGDAAHQMPPFLGQGMCSGIRDAQNIAFKLNLVLAGAADLDLLDTYQLEREPHVRVVIEKGIELGRMQTVRDVQLAAARDRALMERRATAQAPESIRFPGLHDGFLAKDSGPGRGELSVQGVVDDGLRRDRLDQVVGAGFCCLIDPELLTALPHFVPTALQQAGVQVVTWGDRSDPHASVPVVSDAEATYARWFAELDARAVVVRPDFYVYGTAGDARAAERLLFELLDDLGTPVSAGSHRETVLSSAGE
jgi:3-(3-hydroxy-phenyl)propionate hydroxylase/flavoprotein hydroxylase